MKKILEDGEIKSHYKKEYDLESRFQKQFKAVKLITSYQPWN